MTATGHLLDGLRPHPRLLLDEGMVHVLLRSIADGGEPAALADLLRAQAADLLGLPPCSRVMEGRRLLGVSREVLRRCLVIGTVWRLDGGDALRDRLLAESEAAAAFSDWNPGHFLDVAEMSTALAIAYDWLHPALGRERLTGIRRALLDLGLRPGSDNQAWWVEAHNNWNQVCHGGLGLACLALAEEEPALAQRLLARARQHIGTALSAYAPAGVYPEGPMYWRYGTTYSVLLEACLESALGRGWGLLEHPGFSDSFDFVLAMQGPTGCFNWSDGSRNSGPSPCHRWAAARCDRPDWAAFASASLAQDRRRKDRFLPLELIWWRPGPALPPKLPLAWCARGTVEVAALRSAWDSPTALFAGLKAGALGGNHGHLDAGSLVFDADGRRFCLELGADRAIYERTDTWGREQDSIRWDYLRCGSQGHSVPLLGGRQQRVAGVNPLLEVGEDQAGRRWARADLSAAYAGSCRVMQRGVAILSGRRLLVQDEFAGCDPSLPLRWNWLAPGRPRLSADGRTACLDSDGVGCELRLLAPAQGRFSVRPADPPNAEESPNPDCSFISLDLDAPLPDPLTVAVLVLPDSARQVAPVLVPLADWPPP